MANYKLAFYTSRDKEIEWFKELSIDPKDAHKLKTLVDFTLNFRNEEALKNYLSDKDLICVNDYKYRLGIFYQNKGKLIPLVYGITYSDSKNYFNVDYLAAKIKSLSNDVDFLNKLSNFYRNTYFQGNNVQDIRTYAINLDRGVDILPEQERSVMEALSDLIGKEVYKKDKKTNKYVINYRGLRDLATFVYHYIDLKEKKKLEDIEKEVNDSYRIDDIDTEVFNEPEFPPNSEEEENYNKYLDKLQKVKVEKDEDEDHHYYKETKGDNLDRLINNHSFHHVNDKRSDEVDYEEPMFKIGSKEYKMYLEYLKSLAIHQDPYNDEINNSKIK